MILFIVHKLYKILNMIRYNSNLYVFSQIVSLTIIRHGKIITGIQLERNNLVIFKFYNFQKILDHYKSCYIYENYFKFHKTPKEA